jgi:hypothetical protein
MGNREPVTGRPMPIKDGPRAPIVHTAGDNGCDASKTLPDNERSAIAAEVTCWKCRAFAGLPP